MFGYIRGTETGAAFQNSILPRYVPKFLAATVLNLCQQTVATRLLLYRPRVFLFVFGVRLTRERKSKTRRVHGVTRGI